MITCVIILMVIIAESVGGLLHFQNVVFPDPVGIPSSKLIASCYIFGARSDLGYGIELTWVLATASQTLD